jgi:hypothetical protein
LIDIWEITGNAGQNPYNDDYGYGYDDVVWCSSVLSLFLILSADKTAINTPVQLLWSVPGNGLGLGLGLGLWSVPGKGSD